MTGGAERTVAIVVSRDRREDLLRCLRHVRALQPPCAGIAVVDDASTDGSAAAVRERFPDVHLVSVDTPIGPARARNLGFRRAQRRFGDLGRVLFLDDDAFVRPDTLARLLEVAAARPEVGIVAPKVYRSLGERRFHVAGELKVDLYRGRITDLGAGELDLGQYDRPRDIRACSTCAMLVKTEALQALDGFDEAFAAPAWEDVDLCLRARRHGYAIAYAPLAVVEHLGGKDARGLRPERERAKAENWLLLMRRHATLPEWASFLGLLPVRAIGQAVRQAVAGEPLSAPHQLRGVLQATLRLFDRWTR